MISVLQAVAHEVVEVDVQVVVVEDKTVVPQDVNNVKHAVEQDVVLVEVHVVVVEDNTVVPQAVKNV